MAIFIGISLSNCLTVWNLGVNGWAGSDIACHMILNAFNGTQTGLFECTKGLHQRGPILFFRL